MSLREEWKVQGTIKVLYSSEQLFMKEYGNLIRNEFPELDIRVVGYEDLTVAGGDYLPLLRERIEKEQPDLMGLFSPLYEQLAEEGKLYDLELLTGEDKLELQDFHPGMLQLIRGKAAGKLYGMSPTFNNMGIFYNKDLFNQYEIDYPKDRMTWEELFLLAGRFAGLKAADGTPIYGYAHFTDNPYQLIEWVGRTQGLSATDAAVSRANLYTESWRKTAESVIAAYRSGAVYSGEGASNPFLSGKAAMAIGGSYMIPLIERTRTDNELSFDISDWGIVTAPVDGADPDSTVYAVPSLLFAINGNTPQLRTDAAVMQFLLSDKLTRSRTLLLDALPMKERLLSDPEGRNFQAFYALAPVDATSSPMREAFSMAMQAESRSDMEEALKGGITTDEAWRRIQDKALEVLVRIGAEEGERNEDK